MLALLCTGRQAQQQSAGWLARCTLLKHAAVVCSAGTRQCTLPLLLPLLLPLPLLLLLRDLSHQIIHRRGVLNLRLRLRPPPQPWERHHTAGTAIRPSRPHTVLCCAAAGCSEGHFCRLHPRHCHGVGCRRRRRCAVRRAGHTLRCAVRRLPLHTLHWLSSCHWLGGCRWWLGSSWRSSDRASNHCMAALQFARHCVPALQHVCREVWLHTLALQGMQQLEAVLGVRQHDLAQLLSAAGAVVGGPAGCREQAGGRKGESLGPG